MVLNFVIFTKAVRLGQTIAHNKEFDKRRRIKQQTRRKRKCQNDLYEGLPDLTRTPDNLFRGNTFIL